MTRPSYTPSVRHILKIWREASAEDMASGMDWYARASRLAAALDSDVTRSAAVIAVLSPMLSWPRNVKLANEVYSLSHLSVDEITSAIGCLKKNARKAAEIVKGAEPDDIVSGLKVRSFWLTIADPSNDQAVVIDRHAIDISVGRVTNDSMRTKLVGTPARYAAIASAYARAAEIASRETGQTIYPSAMQAVTWTVWRNTRVANNHGDYVAA